MDPRPSLPPATPPPASPPAPAPVLTSPGPAPAPWPGPSAAPSPRAGGSRGATIVAGLLAMLGGVLMVASTLLPIWTWTDESLPGYTILPILSGDFGPASNMWFALEPLGIAVLAVVLGISLVAAGSPRRTGGGALAAVGMVAILAFTANVLYAVTFEHEATTPAQVAGAGTWAGLLGGVLLLFAGFTAIASAPRRTG